MKKKIACILPFFLLFGTATMTQAQELGVQDTAIHTSDSGLEQSALFEDSFELEDTANLFESAEANQTPKTIEDAIEENPGGNEEEIPPSESVQVSESETMSSTLEDEANQSVSEEPGEDASTEFLEEDEVEEPGDDVATTNTDQNEVTTEDTSEEEMNAEVSEEVAEDLDKNVEQKIEEVSKEKEIKPLLSITLFGLTINILGKNKRENSKFKRSLISFEVNRNFKDDWKVLGIAVNLPVIGEIGVDLIAGKNIKDDKNVRTTMGGLLGIKVTNSKLLGNVNLDVASGQTSRAETGEVVSSKGGVLGVGLNDTKGQAGLNVGVLGGGKEVTEDKVVTHGGLATIDAKSRLGNAHVGLIEGKTMQSGDTKVSRGGLLLADVEDSIIGDAHVGVAEVNKIKTPEYEDTYVGAVNANVSNKVLGDVHLGVGEYRQVETPEFKETQVGLVNTNVTDNPILGNAHLGIGQYYEYKAKNSKNDNSSGNNGKLPGQGNDGNDNPNPNDQSGESNPEPSNPTNPIIPGQEDLGQEKGSDDLGLDASLDGEDTSDTPYKYLKELIDAGNTTVLNQETEIDLETVQNMMTAAKEKAANATFITPANQLASSSSSSGGSSGTSLSGIGSGFAAYFSSSYVQEVCLSNEVHGTLMELSDQWINAPPDQPPKNSFFLSA